MATNRNKVGTSVDSLMSSTPFTGGLNTELSGVIDSTEFTKDELNMLIRADGTRSRRPGVDYEENFTFNNELIDTSKPNLAFNSIEWLDINSPNEAQTYTQIPYIVVQIGYQVIFYKNVGQPYSQEELTYVLDLRDYKITGKSDTEVAIERCRFAVAYGCLFITSKAIQPIMLKSAQDETVPLVEIPLPYGEVSCTAYQGYYNRMGSTSKKPSQLAYYEFYINDLLIGHFDITLAPSETYAAFPNSYTMAQSFNSIDASTRKNITATPFEVSADSFTNEAKRYKWSPEDHITFNASSAFERGLKISIKVFGWYDAKLPVNEWGIKDVEIFGWKSKTNTYSATLSAGYEDYSSSTSIPLKIRDTSKGAEDYLPIDENPKKMSYAHLYNLLNQGWTTKLIADFFFKSSSTDADRIFPGNNLAQQYLKDKKTDAFKPEDLINMTFGNTPAARGHFILDFFNQDRCSTAALDTSMTDLLSKINEDLRAAHETEKTLDDILDDDFPIDPEDPEAQVPVIKPRRNYVADICAYAGRIFYLCGDVLLYSQMISEDINRVNRCYTDADPTSEEMSDVIETDGGLISLPDIGDGLKLAQYGQYLFVFGSRGNAVITGTANNIFTATAYSAGSLGCVPTQAPDSFVSTEFGIFYWGTTGINFLGQGEGGLSVQDLTTSRILTWYGKLSNVQHQWCKGVYSSAKKKIYWFYPSNEESPRRLDCCLVYDIQRGSFAPQKIASNVYDENSEEFYDESLPEVVSGLSLKVPFKSIKEYPVIAEGIQGGELQNFEVEIGDIEESVDNFQGYRDAQQAEGLETLRIPLTTYTGNYSVGAVFKIDLSSYDTMPNGTSKTIVQFRDDHTWETIQTVELQKSNDGLNYAIKYQDTAPLVGFDNTDVLWFVVVNDWRGGTYKTYTGCVPERALGGSGFTAQTVPNSTVSYSKSIQRYLSNYTGSYIICEFDSFATGALEDYTAFVEIDNSNNTFIDRKGPFESDQKYYYRRTATDTMYKLDGEAMIPIGDIRKTYTDYIDFVDGTTDYSCFKDGDDAYYAYSTLSSEHPPVFTFVDGVLTLYGFGDDIPTASTLTFTSLDGLTTITATRDTEETLHGVDRFIVAERDEDLDVYNKYTIEGSYQKILADDPIDSEEFTYESSILVCLDVANQKITFGDFRNNLLKDWTAGDWNGDGYNFNSYLVSHPMNSTSTSQFTGRRITDITHTKNMSYLITYFRRTETGELITGDLIYPSGCQGSILWDWRSSGEQGKWSSPSELYRPYKRTLLDSHFIINKTNIRGLGRAYQVKLESDEAKQFILEGLVYDLKNDGRI